MSALPDNADNAGNPVRPGGSPAGFSTGASTGPEASPNTGGGDRIGDRFVQSGLLTPDQAVRVSQLQQSDGLRFGEAAVQLGYITDKQVQEVLSKQFHYPVAAERSGISADLAIAHAPFSAEAEAIRQIRAELSIRLGNTPGPISLAIVSPNEGEGKSYLAASLAIAFAQAGMRTLLINADMRDTGREKLFTRTGDVGLSTILAGRAAPTAGLPVDNFPLLNVLDAGPPPPNPIEMLHDGALRKLLASLGPGFDVYIVDTPSANKSSDAQVIAQQIGFCLLLGRKHQTRLSDLTATQEKMRTAGAQIVGTIYNEFKGGRTRRGWFGRKRG